MTSCTKYQLEKFFNAETGTIHLSSGPHTIEVALQDSSKQVYLSVVDEGRQVCGGSVSLAGAVESDSGFTLVASVLSNSAVVTWVAI